MTNSAIQDPEWYPSQPKDWKLGRVKTAIESFDSGVWGEDPYDDNSSTPVIRSNELDEGGNWRVTTPALRFLSSSEKKKSRLHEGDLLIVKSSGSHAHIGKTAVVTKRIEDLGSCFSNFTGRIRVLPYRANSRFLWYFLNNSPGRDQLFYYGTTTTGLINLSSTSIGVGVFALPPLPEQQRIVGYLNASCTAIDAAVVAKHHQLETLDSLRRSIIQDSVTKGVDPNAQMVNSSIDWLPEIPNHWEKAKLKRHTQMIRGQFSHRPRNDPAFYDGPYPFIQTGSITAADKYITEFTQTLNEDGLRISKLFPAETVVMTITGAKIAEVAVTSFEACFPDSIVGFVPDHRLVRDYLYYLLVAMKPALLRAMVVTTQPNINYVQIGGNYIPLPPVPEQKLIVNHIEQRLRDIKRIGISLESQIATLTAYRKSLIHECVTGQRRITEADLAWVGRGESLSSRPSR